MRIDAPANGGFSVISPGFARVWLVDDDSGSPGSDIYARPGRLYPLAVTSYELVAGSPHPGGLEWLPEDLGGFEHAEPIDGVESAKISGSIGFYVVGDGTLDVDGDPVTLSSGDFYAGSPDVVTLGEISYLVAIFP